MNHARMLLSKVRVYGWTRRDPRILLMQDLCTKFIPYLHHLLFHNYLLMIEIIPNKEGDLLQFSQLDNTNVQRFSTQDENHCILDVHVLLSSTTASTKINQSQVMVEEKIAATLLNAALNNLAEQCLLA